MWKRRLASVVRFALTAVCYLVSYQVIICVGTKLVPELLPETPLFIKQRSQLSLNFSRIMIATIIEERLICVYICGLTALISGVLSAGLCWWLVTKCRSIAHTLSNYHHGFVKMNHEVCLKELNFEILCSRLPFNLGRLQDSVGSR